MLIREIMPEDNVVLAKIIRKAFHDFDAPVAGTVYEDPTTDNLSSYFEKPRSICWVAEAEGEVAGCCGIYPTPGLPDGCVELVKFYLLSDFRNRGIGAALFDQCISSARDLKFDKIYLESLPEFSQALRLYEDRGFYNIDKALGESGHPGCNIWMVKDL
jgi:putative acetyltransferase